MTTRVLHNAEAAVAQLLQDRNLTSHVYHSELADRIFAAIDTRYAAALTDAITQVSIALR